ncbi:metallopeptidase family protein [candidate division FCPU426 bacterium]|nr:metallopeptidase family protein [candidate division FCPU426 bacterium]
MEKIILEALEKLPRVFQKKMENVEIVLKNRPALGVRRSLGLRAGDTLLGLYQGVPRTRRGADYGNTLPDVITLYREPMAQEAETLENLHTIVQQVLWHEVGHYFGLSEEELQTLEEMQPLGLKRGRVNTP